MFPSLFQPAPSAFTGSLQAYGRCFILMISQRKCCRKQDIKCAVAAPSIANKEDVLMKLLLSSVILCTRISTVGLFLKDCSILPSCNFQRSPAFTHLINIWVGQCPCFSCVCACRTKLPSLPVRWLVTVPFFGVKSSEQQLVPPLKRFKKHSLFPKPTSLLPWHQLNKATLCTNTQHGTFGFSLDLMK